MDTNSASLQASIAQAIRGIVKDLPFSRKSADSIYQQLAQEIIGVARHDDEGQAYAPDQYTLSVHPSSSKDMSVDRVDFQTRLALELQLVLEKQGFILARQPHVTLSTDPTMKDDEVRLIAWHSSDPLGLTDSGEYTQPEIKAPDIPRGAFVVVQGKRHFKLEQPVVRIGRRPENDLVLDDKHVSRSHAMLHAVDGRYVLRDLGSTAGTRLNHNLVKEAIVDPGDIITIATVELIYGEDRTGPPEETPPYTPKIDPKDQIDKDTPLDLKVYDDETTKAPSGNNKD
jgi:pSer/pThr/pTyr-binding forkhead associated (FHA) protein